MNRITLGKPFARFSCTSLSVKCRQRLSYCGDSPIVIRCFRSSLNLRSEQKQWYACPSCRNIVLFSATLNTKSIQFKVIILSKLCSISPELAFERVLRNSLVFQIADMDQNHHQNQDLKILINFKR